ncbi:MAG: LysR substrate-binding domain-containing protein [Planctomycetota bacterium]
MKRPSLRQIEFFVALADQLNFRQAADRCGVSQPAFSAQIQSLEALLGVTLFERDSRRVVPTAIGQELLQHAREILQRTDDMLEQARASAGPLRGTLRLGTIPTVGPYLLPKVLPALQASHPELHLVVHEDLTGHLLPMLDRGELDVLLLAIDVDLGDLPTLPLFSDPFLLAVPKGHQFAKAEQAELAMLPSCDLLLLEDGHCLRDQLKQLCDKNGGRERTDFRASSLGTIMQMVAGNQGLTLVPELAVEREVHDDKVVAVRFGIDGPCRTVGLAWRRVSPSGEEYKKLGAAIVAAYAAAD